MEIFELILSFYQPFITTVLIFILSATLSIVMAILLVVGSASSNFAIRQLCEGLIELSRSLPTVVFVIVFGNLSMLPHFSWLQFTDSFPGVSRGFEVTVILVLIALAFSSAGHLCRIIQSSIASIPHETQNYIMLSKQSHWTRLIVIMFEATPALIEPLCLRLVHHLHNTGFVALFPITDIFAFMRGSVIETAQVIEYLLTATVIYIFLASVISYLGRFLARRMLPHRASENLG